eukprot:UN07254
MLGGTKKTSVYKVADLIDGVVTTEAPTCTNYACAADVTDLQDDVSGNSSGVRLLESEVDTLTTRVSNIEDYDSRISELERKNSLLISNLEALARQNKELQAQIDQISS